MKQSLVLAGLVGLVTFHPLVVGFAALVVVFDGVGQAEAGTLIDFEAFNDMDNLHGINLGGVTLLSPIGVVEVFDDRYGVSFHSATKAIACPDGCASANPLTGVFDDPMALVSLRAGDAGTYSEYDSWKLLAFDAPIGGNLLGQVSSGSWDGSPYRQLKIVADSIWRFEANWTGTTGCGIGYDDLEFEIIPEPSTIVLAAIGFAGSLACVWWRRRRA